MMIHKSFTHSRLILWLLVALLLGLVACNDSAPPTPLVTRDPQVVQGEDVFRLRCASCHAPIPDVVLVGPSLVGVGDKLKARNPEMPAKQQIEDAVLRPGDYVAEGFVDAMPKNFGTLLTGEELDAVVAYLLTLE